MGTQLVEQKPTLADPITSTVVVEKGHPLGSRKSRTQTWVSSGPNLLGNLPGTTSVEQFFQGLRLGKFLDDSNIITFIVDFISVIITPALPDHQALDSTLDWEPLS